MTEKIRTPPPRDLALLAQRAVAVAAFKTRVQVDGMTRPARSPVERALLEGIGAASPFLERDAPGGSMGKAGAMPSPRHGTMPVALCSQHTASSPVGCPEHATQQRRVSSPRALLATR